MIVHNINNIRNIRLSLFRFIYPLIPGRFIILIILSLLPCISLYAQTDLVLHDIVIGNVVVSAPGSVTMSPGFHAVSGCNFHAYIGPLQPSDSSITIDPPEDNLVPLAGSSGNNFILTITYKEPKTEIPSPSTSFRHNEEIQYFDGLGRPSQKILVGASPQGQDIILPYFYDHLGREAIKSLPYTDQKSGSFRSGVTQSTVNNNYTSGDLLGVEPDTRAYDSTGFDNSPLNRVTSSTGPGAAWENKPVTINYLTNSGSEPGWNVSGDYSYSSSDYPANTLFVTETIDEDGNATREYKDKLGRGVLKKSKLGSVWLTTAYIYDDLGLLRCVVPPEAANPNTDQALCYYYLYDDRRRMIEKKIPGSGTFKMVYDVRNRLRFTQNSLQVPENKWSFTKYDELNRPVITGILNSFSSGVSALISSMESAQLNESRNNNDSTGYTNNSFPISNTDILTLTYYDNYDFFNITGDLVSDSLQWDVYESEGYSIDQLRAASDKGRVTCSMTSVLSDPNDLSVVRKNNLYSTFYYDKYGHLLRSVSENHLGGKDVVTNVYEDITYLLTSSKQEHYKGSESIVIEKWFEYDHASRLLATREKINNQSPVTLNAMTYNEAGTLVSRHLHSSQTEGARSFLQKVDYNYNIRGWLTSINEPDPAGNDLFGMSLYYNNPSGMGDNPPAAVFNGNISGIKWAVKNDTIRGYKFAYDSLNRILDADYVQGTSLNSNAGYYSEQITGYDKNGNILGLKRYFNNSLVDDLSYEYLNSGKSNQILRITDSGTENNNIDDYPGSSQDYSYDSNGNMSFDGAKNINVYYFNTLNLPRKIDFGNNNRLHYHYTSSGGKLVKHIILDGSSGQALHYIGNIVYENNTLKYILTDDGRLIPSGEGANRVFKYEYNIKDHLGNSRVTFVAAELGGAVDIVQASDYYPFGLVMRQSDPGYIPGYLKNRYLFNGKELQDDVFEGRSLYWYDYGARFYDPQIGRWNAVDPMAENNHYAWTPYAYVYNNPIALIDPFGLDSTRIRNGFTRRMDQIFNSLVSVFKDPSPINNFMDGLIKDPLGTVDKVLGTTAEALDDTGKKLWSGSNEDFGEVVADIFTLWVTGKALGGAKNTPSNNVGEASKVGVGLSDDAFVHVAPTKYADDILKNGLDPAYSGGKTYVTRWASVKNVTNPKDFNTILYRQNLWKSYAGKFDEGATILHINAKPKFYSPRTNWVNGVPQYIFTSPISPKYITHIKSF